MTDLLTNVFIAWGLVLATIVMLPALIWSGLFLLAFLREGYVGARTFVRMTWNP